MHGNAALAVLPVLHETARVAPKFFIAGAMLMCLSASNLNFTTSAQLFASLTEHL
jgi:hypothetical protein